jgi:hypothetical protein
MTLDEDTFLNSFCKDANARKHSRRVWRTTLEINSEE